MLAIFEYIKAFLYLSAVSNVCLYCQDCHMAICMFGYYQVLWVITCAVYQVNMEADSRAMPVDANIPADSHFQERLLIKLAIR